MESKANLDIQSTAAGKGTEDFRKFGNGTQLQPHVRQLINELNEKTKLIKQGFVLPFSFDLVGNCWRLLLLPGVSLQCGVAFYSISF